jgi:hypothetical protein
MRVLINGGPAIDRFGPSSYVGRLVSPRSGHLIRAGEFWAGDNDAYKAWDEQRFVRMLNRLDGQPGCLFVACPDVVADAMATLDRFWDWRPEIAGRGFPVALVLQDGVTPASVPWDAIDAVFVGGTTRWKLGAVAAAVASEAKARGKHLHVGRVNTRRRLRIAYDMGADTVDGTGWSMFPDKYLRRDIPFVEWLHRRPPAGWKGLLVQAALF